MRNRPIHSSPAFAADQAGWEIDRHPRLRLAALFTALILALLAIAGRLVQVQGSLGDAYAAEFEKTIERREPIVSRDGRIISADGQVLAEDIELFGLTVHYRWLEDPVDPVWLRQQALSRLDRAGRRDARRVDAEQTAILQRRKELWSRLTKLTELDHESLASKRRAIQRRVEQIRDLVERRRAKRIARQAASEPERPSEEDSLWESIRRTVVAALTTPPQREPDEPLIVREQLDYHLLVPEIPLGAAVEIEAYPERFPGTRIESRTRRAYPHSASAAHLVGYRAPLDDEAIAERRARFPQGDPLDYRSGDRQGRMGLERQYERDLRGLRGERRVVFDRRGELVESTIVREPRHGRDLYLSLHLPLQQAAEVLLDEQLQSRHQDETNGKPLPVPPGGAIVAIDVRTGAVLAAASAPRFDLRTFTEHDQGLWGQALADPRKPLFHRAAEMRLPPGSIFKVVTAVALLEEGRIDPQRPFHCQGYLDDPDRLRCFTFRNFGVGHGDLNLVGALSRSCNVYFFSAARRLGSGPLAEWAGRFGFGRPTGIDLPAESRGNIPTATGDLRPGPVRPVSGDALQLAIGQGQLTATPLQVARMMAAMANGGRLVIPRLAETGPRGPSAMRSGSPGSQSTAARIPELSARSLEWVRMGMREVVAHPQGTGYKTVRLRDVAIAGKTGTAEPGGDRPDHAWFAGYVPADRPTIAFVVVLEHAGPGGHAAGPVAREFVQAMLALGLLDGTSAPPPLAN